VIRLGIAGTQHPHIQMAIDEAGRRDDVQLVGLSETEEAVRAAWSKRTGVPGYRTAGDLFDAGRPDAIAVGAANHERAAITAMALSRGIHVLSDKPLCITSAELVEIETAWRGSGAQLSMMLDKRIHPVSLGAAELVGSGRLGDIAVIASTAPHQLGKMPRPPWMFERATYGGILNDLATHDIDLALQLTGAQSGTVFARSRNVANPHAPTFEDHAVCLIQTDGGTLVTVQVDWLSPDGAGFDDYRTLITGTEGTAELLFHDGTLIFTSRSMPRHSIPLDLPRPPVGAFFDALRDRVEPEPAGHQVLRVARLALLCQTGTDAQAAVRWDLAGITPRDHP
jgi:predicted dehydrogenase